MIFSKKLQTVILLLGDIALFYGALFLALILRYRLFPIAGNLYLPFIQIWDIHKWPFFYVHLIWVLIFYISGLYDIKKFSSPKIAMAKVLEVMAIGGMLAVLLFYAIPFFGIAPKTNLFIDVVLVALAAMLWRRYFWLFASKVSKIKILFFGSSPEVEGLADYLKTNVQLGYEPAVILASVDHNLIDLIHENKIHLIVASRKIMQNENAVRRFYEALPLGVSTMDFPTFYENVAEKIPVSAISESWFLANLVEIHKQIFEFSKRIFDVILAIILAVPAAILFPFIAALSKIESRDKIFVRQPRVGKNGKVFTLYKFRNMYHAAEIDGKPRWTEKNDPRITKVGGFLRKTRLDELPQIINVLKGEMSFIGPRPERPEFVEILEKQIPHYAMRHLVKPGLSGWAQIKFPYGASIEDAMEKLQYDLYYIKNRSLALDAAIALRTLVTMFRREGR